MDSEDEPQKDNAVARGLLPASLMGKEEAVQYLNENHINELFQVIISSADLGNHVNWFKGMFLPILQVFTE